MVYKYVVTLKNKNRQLVDIFSVLVMIASLLFFILISFTYKENVTVTILTIVITAVVMVIDLIRKNRSKKPYSLRISLFITGFAWLLMPEMKWIGFIIMLLSMIESVAKFPVEIGFTDERITINSFPRKIYGWNDFNNIILTGGYLTLDFKSNRFIQQEVLDDDEFDADEDEFNEYCQTQLAKGS